MSGLNSLSSETKEGIEFDEIAIKLFKKYNLNIIVIFIQYQVIQ